MNTGIDTQIGWFSDNSLQGYGKKGSSEGFYQTGDHYSNKESITYYDTEIDYIA